MGVSFIDDDYVRINGFMVNAVEKLAKEGACREEDPDLFFPDSENEGRTIFEAVRQAKAICHACPVVDLCLEYALKNDPYGVWGATTEADRKQIRIDRRKRAEADRKRRWVEQSNLKKYGVTVRGVSEKSKANLKRGNSKALEAVNAERAIEANAKVLSLLSEVMEQIKENEKPETIATAQYRLDHPALTLTQFAEALGVSRGVANGRIRRLMEKYGK